MRLVYIALLLSSHVCSTDLALADMPEGKHVVFQGRNEAGFFACFNIAIGALDDYDTGKIRGLTIDFGEFGPYYEAARGKNWWNYYFDPISLGRNDIPFFSLNPRDNPHYDGYYASQGDFHLPRAF